MISFLNEISIDFFFYYFQESETETERLSLPEKLGFITSPKAQELKIPTARPKIEPVSQTFDLFRPVYICNNYLVCTTVKFWKDLQIVELYYPVVT